VRVIRVARVIGVLRVVRVSRVIRVKFKLFAVIFAEVVWAIGSIHNFVGVTT
jgi:hypothetical protein